MRLWGVLQEPENDVRREISRIEKKETGDRSNKIKGFFSVENGVTLLDGRPRKRGMREFIRRCGTTMLAHQFAALIRIHHGITEKLGSLTHIT